MKAIVSTTYGSPDVFQLKEIEKPTPKAGEVLVKVYAAAANPADWHLMRGTPVIFRLDFGFPRPKNTILGSDVAGVVEAVGSGVTQFQPGDEVLGELSLHGLGCFAEYVAAPEDAFAPKPANIMFEQAAATPLAAITALQGLRDSSNIQAGERVLINGASGGVGTFSVQYAKAVGAEVTGVCSTRNLDLVRSIGADHVIDYTQEDFARTGQQYDLIFDAVGNRTAADYRRALKPGGRCVVTGFTTMRHMFGQVVLLGALGSRFSKKKVGMMGTAKPNPDDLRVLADLLERGALVPMIDRTYPLSETAEAIRYLETMRARGKIVITVAE